MEGLQMKSAMLMLTTSAVIFACGTVAANAQDNPVLVIPGGSTMQQQPDQQDTIGQGKEQQDYQNQLDEQTIGQGGPQRLQEGGQREEHDEDRTDAQGYRAGMMGWHGRGMMGRDEGAGWMHHRCSGRREGGGPGMMGGGIAPRIIFSLMDSDGDGKLSLEEFRAAHDRIFKAMDADKDGTVTMQEMMDFMRGTTRPASQP
jgi:hypothetical protein